MSDDFRKCGTLFLLVRENMGVRGNLIAEVLYEEITAAETTEIIKLRSEGQKVRHLDNFIP